MAAHSNNHEPRIGRSKSNMATKMMSSAEANDRIKYGIVLPITYVAGLTGDILTCSIVPRSFTRTIESAVEITAVIIEM